MQRIVRGLQLYERKLYCRRKKNRLKNKDFSIIASNCNGTFMYYDMRIRYLTPTVNLVIEMNDFVKLAENLEAYMAVLMKRFRDLTGCLMKIRSSLPTLNIRNFHQHII